MSTASKYACTQIFIPFIYICSLQAALYICMYASTGTHVQHKYTKGIGQLWFNNMHYSVLHYFSLFQLFYKSTIVLTVIENSHIRRGQWKKGITTLEN